MEQDKTSDVQAQVIGLSLVTVVIGVLAIAGLAIATIADARSRGLEMGLRSFSKMNKSE